MPKSSRGRPGCLICKARKVKCDNPIENCTPCSKMRLSCPGSRASTSPNTNPSTEHELSEIVNEAFKKAGRKRRHVGACQACQVSKNRCSRDRPCLRCEDKGLSCVYLVGRLGAENTMSSSIQRRIGRGERRNERESQEEGEYEEQDQEEEQEQGRGKIPTQGLGTLPQRIEHDTRVRALCEIFFVHVHPLRCLSFIHKPSFMQSLDLGRVLVDFGEALVFIVCAFGERFSAIFSTGPRLQPSTPGTNWAERAQELALSNLGKPSVSNLMALVLLCEWHIRFGQESAAFMISGIASRLAQLLRLDAEPAKESLDGIPSSLIAAEKESRRRLVWSCYVLDVTISSGVDLISNWPSVPRTRLPCSAREFILQLQCETATLCAEAGAVDGDKQYNICLEAYFVRIIYLRKQVLRLIRQDNPTTLSEFNQLVSSLEECGSGFPKHLQLNEINAYIHEENHQLAAFYALHLLYNQCFCDLYRVTLPGYRFPLSDAIAREEPERVGSLRDQCVERAQVITDIIRGALSRGSKGFTDSICSICAYESTKIQIIYARTCTGEGSAGLCLKRNIQTNLQALNIMFEWDKKRDALLSSLSSLLQEFGFSDLATNWLDRNGTSFPSNKEDGTPESYHLHPLSLYRMAWKEISWPRKPDTNVRMQVPQFNSTKSMNIDSEVRNDIAGGDNFADMTDPAAGSSFNLDELPTAETMMDIDSYLQIADDFSNYLTWDPWDFGYA